jgi:hypothetical protein
MARQLPKYSDLIDDDARTAWHEEGLATWLEEVYEHPVRLIIERIFPPKPKH